MVKYDLAEIYSGEHTHARILFGNHHNASEDRRDHTPFGITSIRFGIINGVYYGGCCRSRTHAELFVEGAAFVSRQRAHD